jgi:hypothetical protein
LGVNFAPKLANIGISCPACVQTVHLINLSPEQNHFPGQAYRDGPQPAAAGQGLLRLAHPELTQTKEHELAPR